MAVNGPFYQTCSVGATQPGGALIIAVLLVLVLAMGVAIWVGKPADTIAVGTAYPIAGTNGNSPDSGLDVGPKVGDLAPDFELIDVNTGKPVTLSALRGKPVWINYFATWCPPCKAELPIIQQEYARYKEAGLAVVGINMREDPAYLKAFAVSSGYSWTFVVDTDGQVTNRYYVYGIPSHFFIDRKGIIRDISVGSLSQALMEEKVAKLLSE